MLEDVGFSEVDDDDDDDDDAVGAPASFDEPTLLDWVFEASFVTSAALSSEDEEASPLVDDDEPPGLGGVDIPVAEADDDAVGVVGLFKDVELPKATDDDV